MAKSVHCRSQWPRGVRRRVAPLRLLGLQVRILSPVSFVCFEVHVSAMGRSLVQRSPTECNVSECDLETSTTKRPGPTRGCPAMGRAFIKYSKKCKISRVGFSEIKERIFSLLVSLQKNFVF